MPPRLFWAFALGFIACGSRAESPDWLTTLAAQPVPEFKGDPPAVVLLDDNNLELDNRGEVVTTHRWAVRILHRSAHTRASGSVYYNGKSDKVLAAKAWLLRGKETVKTAANSEWTDRAAGAGGSVVDEMRSRSCSLSSDALVGDVFGCETKVRSSLLVAQCAYTFGGSLPTLTERVAGTVPAGFRIRALFSGPRLPVAQHSADGRTYTWTATNRPYRPDEPFPGRSAFVDAELFVWIDPAESATGFAPKRFASWGEVASWAEQLNEDAFDTSPLLAAKARELTAAAGDDALAKIRALAAYVQGTRYIAINEGLRAGLGYKARKASVVFANGFGDCKDKANLLRAMLREAGLRAHLAIARIGNPLAVHPECPTPAQFDHAVVAISVDAAVDLPGVVQVAKLGRLLLFDPTDEHTLVGDLPAKLQGTRVLVLSREGEALLDVPELAPEQDFKFVRQATIALQPDGSVRVTGKVEGSGQAGTALRHALKEADVPKKLEELATDQLSEGFKGALILEKATEDDRIGGRCSLSFACAKNGFVQRLQGAIMVVKLNVLSRANLPVFAEKERFLPLRCEPLCLDDAITLRLPAGQTVEELPAGASLDSAYGRYRLRFESVDGAVVMHRTVSLNKLEVPAADYARLKGFLSDIARADRCSVILKQGGGPAAAQP